MGVGQASFVEELQEDVEDLGVRLEGKDLKDVKVVGDVVDLIAARVDA